MGGANVLGRTQPPPPPPSLWTAPTHTNLWK